MRWICYHALQHACHVRPDAPLSGACVCVQTHRPRARCRRPAEEEEELQGRGRDVSESCRVDGSPPSEQPPRHFWLLNVGVFAMHQNRDRSNLLIYFPSLELCLWGAKNKNRKTKTPRHPHWTQDPLNSAGNTIHTPEKRKGSRGNRFYTPMPSSCF